MIISRFADGANVFIQKKVELGGRVVRVLDSGQLHQSERSWVRFLDGPLKIVRPQDSHVVTCPAG